MDLDDLADWAAVPKAQVKAGVEAMVRMGMLLLDGDTYVVAKFGDRQFESDSSAERVAKHRKEQRCNGLSVVDVTPPETETETDTQSPSSTEPAGSDPGVVGGVLDEVVELRFAAERDSIRSPEAWRRGVRRSLATEDARRRISELAAAYPSATVRHLAEAFEGRTQVLRYLPRAETT